MKKFLTILVLALALCLVCGLALAENEYKAVFNGDTLTDNTQAEDITKYTITDVDGNAITPGTGSYAQIEPGQSIVHLQKNWVMLHINVVVSGVEITETLHVPVLLHEAQHDWKATTGKDAQCRVYDKECSICHEKTLKDPVEYDHVYVEKVLKAYTCTEEGKFILVCKDCGVEFGTVKVVPPHHDLACEWTVVPNCLDKNNGYVRVYCTACGVEEEFGPYTVAQYIAGFTVALDTDIFGTEVATFEIPANADYNPDGHDMDAWVTLTARDCFNPKQSIRWCKVCREYFETLTDPAGPLDPVYEDTQYISCTWTGKIVKNCLLCEGKAPGHSVEYADLAAAVAAEPEKFVVTHTFDHKAAYKVSETPVTSCTVDGEQEYKCIFDGVADYAAYHTAGSYDYDKVILKAPGHAWTEWKLVVGVDEEGNELAFYRRYCTREWSGVPCGEVDRYFGELPPSSACKEHTWVKDEANSVAPDCTNPGVIAYKCSVCGIAKDETEVDPATGHDFSVEVIIESTCSKEGVSIKTCKVCGKVEKGVVEKKDHTFGEWVVTKEATKEADGEETRTCTVCGEAKETRPVKYVITADPKYAVTALAYNGKTVTGKLVHDEDTLDATNINVRVTFFIEGNYYMATIGEVAADGTFAVDGVGPIEYISVVATGSSSVSPEDVKAMGSGEITVK